MYLPSCVVSWYIFHAVCACVCCLSVYLPSCASVVLKHSVARLYVAHAHVFLWGIMWTAASLIMYFGLASPPPPSRVVSCSRFLIRRVGCVRCVFKLQSVPAEGIQIAFPRQAIFGGGLCDTHGDPSSPSFSGVARRSRFWTRDFELDLRFSFRTTSDFRWVVFC